MHKWSHVSSAIIISLVLAGLATTFMTMSLATDYWEVTEFSASALRKLDIDNNSSILNDINGYYKIVMYGDPSVTGSPTDNSTGTGSDVTTTYHLRATNGGIWRICDRITDAFRKTIDESVGPPCFTYITDYHSVKQDLDDNGVWLVRMQNSAASCYIVTLLSLFTAVITGAIGLLVKQVSACMVTGVMYVVAGTFGVFGLVIMHTKVSFMQTHCRSLDPLPAGDLCGARSVSVGWSLPLAWVSFVFCLFACGSWLFLARCLRLEKGKTII